MTTVLNTLLLIKSIHHYLILFANTAERLNMTKQCGNCDWFLRCLGECNYPEELLPACTTKWLVDEEDGKNCPVYREKAND